MCRFFFSEFDLPVNSSSPSIGAFYSVRVRLSLALRRFFFFSWRHMLCVSITCHLTNCSRHVVGFFSLPLSNDKAKAGGAAGLTTVVCTVSSVTGWVVMLCDFWCLLLTGSQSHYTEGRKNRQELFNGFSRHASLLQWLSYKYIYPEIAYMQVLILQPVGSWLSNKCLYSKKNQVLYFFTGNSDFHNFRLTMQTPCSTSSLVFGVWVDCDATNLTLRFPQRPWILRQRRGRRWPVFVCHIFTCTSTETAQTLLEEEKRSLHF